MPPAPDANEAARRQREGVPTTAANRDGLRLLAALLTARKAEKRALERHQSRETKPPAT